MKFYMSRKAKEFKDIEEFTFAIALLGGILAILLKIIDYFTNEPLESDASSKPIVFGLIAFLLIELLMIFSFFIFKGISVYTKSERDKFKPIADGLLKTTFILALIGAMVSISIVFFKYFFSFEGWYLYLVIGLNLFISWFYLKTEIKDLLKIIKNLNLLTKLIFGTLFFFLLMDFRFFAPLYLLTGSYSIEQSSPSIDNTDMIIFTMKEKGISYDYTEVWLYRLNSPQINSSNESGVTKTDYINNIDYIRIYRNSDNVSRSNYIWGIKYNMVWYFNVINISNLSSGNYLLHVEVKDNSYESSFGASKRRDDMLFYIPPKKTN